MLANNGKKIVYACEANLKAMAWWTISLIIVMSYYENASLCNRFIVVVALLIFACLLHIFLSL